MGEKVGIFGWKIYLKSKNFFITSDFLDKLYLEYGYVELCDGVVGEGGVGDGFRH